MENAVDPVSPATSMKENKWNDESSSSIFADNSPEFNPISYEFLPHRISSPKGDETPVAKRKRTTPRSYRKSPVARMLQRPRLLPPPQNEPLEELRKYTNLYKALLGGIGGNEVDENVLSEDEQLFLVNSEKCLENGSNESNSSTHENTSRRNSNTILVSDRMNDIKSNKSLGNEPSTSKQLGNTRSVRSRETKSRPNSRKEISKSDEAEKRLAKSAKKTTKMDCTNKKKENSPDSEPKLLDVFDQKEEEPDTILSWFEEKEEEPDTILSWFEDFEKNEILLLHDGNDDGFTCIDDNTLSFLCSGSQSTTQVYNVQEKKCSRTIERTQSKCSAQEIERKRQEAMKRLSERRKINSQIHSQKVS